MEYSLIALGQERTHKGEINRASDLHAHYNEISEKTRPSEITNGTMPFQTEREINLFQWNQLMHLFMNNSASYTPAILPPSWNHSAILPTPNQTNKHSTTTSGFAIQSQLSNSLYSASLETTETEQTKTKISNLQASGRGHKFTKYLNPPTTAADLTKTPVAKQKSSSFSIPNLLAVTPSPTLNRCNSGSGSDNRKQSSNTKVISIPAPERHNCKLCTRTYSTQTGLIRHEAHKHNNVIWRTNKAMVTKNPHSSSSDSTNTTEFRSMCGSSKARSKLIQASKEVNCSPPSMFSVTTLNTRLIDTPSPYHCDRPFCCHVCTKIYYSMSALKMHVRTHTLPCKCSLCGKAFSRMWLLNGHLRTHTGEKPFACVVCARAFADRSNLRAHMQTHSEVKRYRCPRCAKTFSRMGLLTKHQSSTCGLLLNGSMVDRHSETQTPTTSGETLAMDSDASTSPHSPPNTTGRSPHKTCGFEGQKCG
ncbi:Zinc finger C2H2 type [Paragonimus heterotremus]|uniref:Zinc finger C2H2 type n=1 Tax=Paragonimus heterotremus TaxID=100268 RepID=A0A8J4TK85_9TREM|nr:Zinc finger C2H2 type [Paragonimus heterotremus]